MINWNIYKDYDRMQEIIVNTDCKICIYTSKSKTIVGIRNEISDTTIYLKESTVKDIVSMLNGTKKKTKRKNKS